MIDPQAEVATERTRAVIPPREMPAILSMQSKRIRETKVFYLLQRGVLLVAEHDPSLPQSHVVYVTLFGCDVEIST